jgi:hypothetical protein
VKALAALALVLAGAGAAPEAAELRFVTCPIYRDTDSGAKSGCWLVDDPATGLRYDVSGAPSRPDWNRAVLVEGRRSATAGKGVCGGIALDPVRTAVLDQPCTRFVLAAEGFTGRRFALPRRNVRPLYEERRPAARPWGERRIAIPFDFGRHFIVYQLSDYYLDQAIAYALDVQPADVTVTGFARTEPMRVSGQLLAEPAALARERAEVVARALALRGVPPARIRIAVAPAAPSVDEAFDGLEGPSHSRVEVLVQPRER